LRFVPYDAVREVAMAETTILMREPRMTEAIAMSENGRQMKVECPRMKRNEDER
jgi:hypothetical protein